jgi:hypothetical protein
MPDNERIAVSAHLLLPVRSMSSQTCLGAIIVHVELTAKRLCGARTRAGGSCRCRALANGRCKFHGGMSTGPRTPEGRARSIAALRAGYVRWCARRHADTTT